MFKNYLKIAWRNIAKNKIFSLINIIGLTIGISASFVIGLIIYYDATFDDFHPDKDRIYRTVSNFSSPTGSFYNGGITLALKDAIKDNPNYEELGSFFMKQPMSVTNPDTNVKFDLPKHVIWVEQEYFNIFQYQFIAGNSVNPIVKPNSVVLTKERAKQYFPNIELAEIIGKNLVYDDKINAEVTGIVEQLPGRTDMVFQEFISWPTLLQTSRKKDLTEKKWNSTTSQSQLFVKLVPNANMENIQQQLDQLAKEHQDEESKKYGEETQFALQPLEDIHFNENYGLFDWSEGRISKSLLINLGLVALFLLLLGCINFINLNTAQATQRSKEIGIRKTLGSSRKQLVWQFIGETFLLVLISALLSLLLTKWLLGVFSDFVPSGLEFEIISSPFVILGIIMLLALVTFLSGFYPAMVLSKFNAVSVLKNNLTLGDRKAKLRKTLTVFQFTIAQIFIIGTLFVGKQINYLLNEDMGFKTESVVTVYQPITNQKFSKLQLFANQLNTIPQVEEASLSYRPPASNSSNITSYTRKRDSIEMHKEVFCLYGDTNYVGVFDINILAGRDRKNDTIRELVLNETAIKAFGFESPEAAVGQFLDDYDGKPIPIVGVMADFHLSSLRSSIPPTVLMGDWYRPEWHQFQAVSMTVRSNEEGNLSTGVAKIEEVYKEIYPDTDMRLEFMDETVESFYNQEQKISTLLQWATGLSILISCLGLLGLVIYTTNRRVKEIGVRKVLGASVMQINTLLCKEFIILVGIAFVVASPIAYYGAYEWLKDFSYKIGISWWVFVLSGFAMIVFAVLVMSVRTLQAANANPVNSLRSE